MERAMAQQISKLALCRSNLRTEPKCIDHNRAEVLEVLVVGRTYYSFCAKPEETEHGC